MATNVLINGESGTGKSRSLLNLNPDECFLINVNQKPLPFRGWKKKFTLFNSKENPYGNMLNIDQYDHIIKAIDIVDKNNKIKIGIIDDAQYIMANEFMRRSKEKGYDKFNEIGNHYWDIIWRCQLCRQDMVWFFLSHVETVAETGVVKAKTIGKMLDDKICIEGMFTIVLNTSVEDGKYFFETQNNGRNTSKSPEGMFPAKIENDLQLVINSIKQYEEGE